MQILEQMETFLTQPVLSFFLRKRIELFIKIEIYMFSLFSISEGFVLTNGGKHSQSFESLPSYSLECPVQRMEHLRRCGYQGAGNI